MNEKTRKAILDVVMKDPNCSVNIDYAVEYKEKLQDAREENERLKLENKRLLMELNGILL